jgi:indole-3-glycerol phosphate synthase/phosphoribosylanthranilate isomerase
MSKLQHLLDQKRHDVEMRKRMNASALQSMQIPTDDRRIRWSKRLFHIIAELKRSSLSAGSIRKDLDLISLARAYQTAGVSAISVLTEEHYFHGSIEDLRNVRTATSIPLLQKDFIIDPFQILEAKQAGAEFVILIARFLTRHKLSSFLRLCDEIQINAIVEITDERDLEKLSSSVLFLGINSRDLETLQVDTGKFARLRKLLPDESFLIAESGISTVEKLLEIYDLGFHAALIGEHFLRAPSPSKEVARFLKALRTVSEITHTLECGDVTCQLTSAYKPRVKICGITREQDAFLAVKEGADALGFIFAESPRRIDPESLLGFRHRIPGHVQCVGVFRGQTQDEIRNLIRKFSFDAVQVYDSLEFSIPTWHARTIHSNTEIPSKVQTSGDQVLWDLKIREDQLNSVWKKLGQQKVFALAGSLNPENVEQAISLCKPDWIDVARGVEKAPGIKDRRKLRDLMKAVHSLRAESIRKESS